MNEILKDSTLFEPLKNLNSFVDSQLLKECIEKRQEIRKMRRKSSTSLVMATRQDRITFAMPKNSEIYVGQKEGLIKGIYVFVYLLMFTALNLEYKCVH